MWDQKAENIYHEWQQLSKVVELIRKDIKRAYNLRKIEKEKYDRDCDHSINLYYELSNIGTRLHQLQIEENLPEIKFPAPHLHNPKLWISKVEDIIIKEDNPYLAAFYVRLKLDRIRGANIIVYILKQGKPIEGSRQYFRTYPLKEYIKKMDRLLNSVTSTKQRIERDNQIKDLKNCVEITDVNTFRKGLLFMTEKEILDLESEDIDWLIFSLCNNSKLKKKEEFPPNKLSFDSLKKAKDFRSVVKYFFDRQIFKIHNKDHFYELMATLIYTNSKGNSLSAWRESLNEKRSSTNYFAFHDESIKFTDFKLAIQK